MADIFFSTEKVNTNKRCILLGALWQKFTFVWLVLNALHAKQVLLNLSDRLVLKSNRNESDLYTESAVEKCLSYF